MHSLVAQDCGLEIMELALGAGGDVTTIGDFTEGVCT